MSDEEQQSSGAANFRCLPLNLSVSLRPRRDAPSLLLSAFSIELEARIWFAAPQRRYASSREIVPTSAYVDLPLLIRPLDGAIAGLADAQKFNFSSICYLSWRGKS
jgi:hypothetical protein